MRQIFNLIGLIFLTVFAVTPTVKAQSPGMFGVPPPQQSPFLQGGGGFPTNQGNPGPFPQFQQPGQFWNPQHGASGLGGPLQQSIRKSLNDMYADLFHPERAHDPNEYVPVTLPSLTNIKTACHPNSFFFSMNPNHMEAIENVKNIIYSFNTTAERISAANALRHSGDVNTKVWYYALSGCSVHDPELQGIRKPSPIEVMPDMFIGAEVFRRAIAESGQAADGAQPGSSDGSQQNPEVEGPQDERDAAQQSWIPQGPASQQQSWLPEGQGSFGQEPWAPQIPMGPPNQGYQQPQHYGRVKRQAGQCVQLDGSIGADNGIENRLWYFREDIQLNAHHWYWHLFYPPTAQTRADRRGELFYYMHASMLGRYNAERLSNGLPRITAFSPGLNANIPEGYFAHLQDANSGQRWTDRPSNVPFTDILHQNDPNLGITIRVQDHILTPRDRILLAINQTRIRTANGQTISLLTLQGIDQLGDIVQSNRFSLNQQFYGVNQAGIHNSGHVVLAAAADPRYQTRTPPGPMADTSTSMRDVIFYRWHLFMNNIFDAHKRTLAAYTPTGGNLPLLWPGVQIVSINVVPAAGGNPNQLQTYWNTLQFPFTRGLDFARPANSAPINICARHLDHRPFSYQIIVDKANNVATTRATVRIFLAPRFNEQGNRFSMVEQRSLFFVLDTFTATLNAGRNTIVRNSTASSLTIPWQQTIQEANNDPNMQRPFCGCGWPHHLLLPKGTPNGMVFDLFVMLTNGDQDAVAQTTQQPTNNCVSAPLYCGIPNQRYPDTKPMGYPFDRLPYLVNGAFVPNLDAYVQGITNAGTVQVTITGP